MPDDQPNFYKSEYFTELSKRFDRLERKLDQQNIEIASIKAKLSWTFGYAAGAAAVLTLIFEYIKARFFGHS